MRTDDLIQLLASDRGHILAQDRAYPLRSAAGLAATVLVVLGLVLATIGPRAGLLTGALTTMITMKLAATIAAAGAGFWLARRLSQPVSHGRSLIWLLPAGVIAVLSLWDLATFGTDGWRSRMAGDTALYCVTLIPLVSALPLAVLLRILRARAAASPTLAGAAAGLAAAGIGASIYALHCTEDSPLFLALWYSLAAGIVVAAGAVAGRRMLAW